MSGTTECQNRVLPFCHGSRVAWIAVWVFALVVGLPHVSHAEAEAKDQQAKDSTSEFSWEMPGRVSIYDLQFGPAILKDKKWDFLGNMKTFSAGEFKGRLTLMVRFSYRASKAEIPIKFIIKLPGARQYEETVNLTKPEGKYSYHFTIHDPENFIGSGSVYLYYGFSMVDVLPFTIMPGS